MTYTKITIAKPFEGAPHINLPGIYGASPNKPVILRIPVTGQRPITYGAGNLPEGLKLENGIVTSLISKEEVEKAEIETFVESKFGGSLPAFVAAFTKRQDISKDELDEVQRMIDRIRKGGGSK